MKKLLTRFLALVMCFSVGFAMVGCDNDKNATQNNTTNESTQSTPGTDGEGNTPTQNEEGEGNASNSNKEVQINKTYKGVYNDVHNVYVKLLDKNVVYVVMESTELGESEVRWFKGEYLEIEDNKYVLNLLLEYWAPQVDDFPYYESVTPGGVMSATSKIDRYTEYGQLFFVLYGDADGYVLSSSFSAGSYDDIVDISVVECADETFEEGAYALKYREGSNGIKSASGVSLYLKDNELHEILNTEGQSSTFVYEYVVVGDYLCYDLISIYQDEIESGVIAKKQIIDSTMLNMGYSYYEKIESEKFEIDEELSFTTTAYYYVDDDGVYNKRENKAYSLKLKTNGDAEFVGPKGTTQNGKWYIVDEQILVILDKASRSSIISFAVTMCDDGSAFSKQNLLDKAYIAFFNGSSESDYYVIIPWTDNAMTFFDAEATNE